MVSKAGIFFISMSTPFSTSTGLLNQFSSMIEESEPLCRALKQPGTALVCRGTEGILLYHSRIISCVAGNEANTMERTHHSMRTLYLYMALKT